MTSAGRTELTGTVVLGEGTPLEAQLTVRPQPKDVDRPVQQPTSMNLPAAFTPNDPILGIDDVEHLVGRLADLGIHTRPRSMMAFHRLVSSRSCFFHRGSQAASWFQKRSEWSM